LVKDYNYGEIARAGIGFPQAYALRNRYALPAALSFSSAVAHGLKTAKDERPSRLPSFEFPRRVQHAAPTDSTPAKIAS
jgi:hypothetical protein